MLTMIELVILIGAFVGGAAAGFLALLRIGMAKEGHSLRDMPPTRIAMAARYFTSLRVQMPGADADPADGCR
jgi:hypothetical protein